LLLKVDTQVDTVSEIRMPLSNSIREKMYQTKFNFIKNLNLWTHFVTLTYVQPCDKFITGEIEVLRRTRLFLSRLNRHIYGRHGCRRNGFRVGSYAVLGWGIYGSHPHMHWLFERPTHMTNEEFINVIELIASSTRGIGKERDIQIIYSPRVIEYIVEHGFEGWIEQVTFVTKCAVR